MSFQALARKWRPERFDQLVGQPHVVRALSHALDNDKLHHALLFSGTRGVGKTTLARIIAKCLNCEYGVSASPCTGEQSCDTCREIDEGRYVDLIEVDAASRTGVDDTRELMDNVQYAPTRGRTKVYLIDEVHMLTRHSFNALLKTLEEPPPRVQFLLATTEPEKIPVTILSRCLQFPLKRLPVAQIAGRLRAIMDAEELSADDQALEELARGADGSMRDGLSLLDQALAFGGGHLDADSVRDMLGTIGDSRIAELVSAVINARATEALDALEALYRQGIDMHYLLEALATAWQHIATIQVVGQAVDDDSARWESTAQNLDPRTTQLFYDITLTGIRDLTYAPDPLVGVKMTVLRLLAFKPAVAQYSEPRQEESETPGLEQRSSLDGNSLQMSLPSAAASSISAAPKQNAREAMAQARAQLQGGISDSGTEKKTDSPLQGGGAVAESSHVAHEMTPGSTANPQQGMNATEQSAETAVVEPADLTAEVGQNEAPTGEKTSTQTNQPDADDCRVVKSSSEAADHEDMAEHWHDLVQRLDVQGLAAQLAHNVTCRHISAELIELEVARANKVLITAEAKRGLSTAIAAVWQQEQAPGIQIHEVDAQGDTLAKRHKVNAEKRQQDAVASMENDPIIQQLRSHLGARLRTETIKPHRLPGTMQSKDET